MRHTDKNTMQYVQKRSYVFLYKQYNLRVGTSTAYKHQLQYIESSQRKTLSWYSYKPKNEIIWSISFSKKSIAEKLTKKNNN